MASPPARPLPPAPAESPPPSLETRIRLVEARLVQRDADVRLRLRTLADRLRTRWQPRRLAITATAVLAGAVAFGALIGRGRMRPRARWGVAQGPSVAYGAMGAMGAMGATGGLASGGKAGAALGGHRGGLPWVRLLGLVWPMLPAQWRARVSPTTAAAAVSIGLPLVETLLHRRPIEPLPTVPALDLMAFSGTWHEIARLPPGLTAPLFEPACAGPARWRFVPRDDGLLEVFHRCSGVGRRSRGLVRPVPGSGGARWQQSFWPWPLNQLPGAWHDLWVLHADLDHGVALLGNPGRDRLVMLSRRPWLSQPRVQGLIQVARDRGYAVRRLRFARMPAELHPEQRPR